MTILLGNFSELHYHQLFRRALCSQFWQKELLPFAFHQPKYVHWVTFTFSNIFQKFFEPWISDYDNLFGNPDVKRSQALIIGGPSQTFPERIEIVCALISIGVLIKRDIVELRLED